MGQFTCLLLTVDMVAVSQASSPESNPNSPLPVITTVIHYITVQSMIGQKFDRFIIKKKLLPLYNLL